MQACGEAGQPCCFTSDPSSEALRCAANLTCIVSGAIGYGDASMYTRLQHQPALVQSAAVMGTCK